MIDYGHCVKLGPLCEEHLDSYREARNDRRIWRWCRQKSLIDEMSHEAWFEAQSADPTIEMFEVLDTADELVGVCGLTDINHHAQRAEFSLYIMPEHHGNGYAEGALRTLVNFGFKELNLNMVFGETVGENPAEALFEKVGFIHTGFRPSYYFKDGAYQDSHLWCLLRDSWEF